MNAAQVDEKAGKKQEEGKMDEDGECFNRPGKVQLIDALRKESPNPCSLCWIVPWLGDPDITTSPLL